MVSSPQRRAPFQLEHLVDAGAAEMGTAGAEQLLLVLLLNGVRLLPGATFIQVRGDRDLNSGVIREGREREHAGEGETQSPGVSGFKNWEAVCKAG